MQYVEMGVSRGSIDFLVVGAQKSGTTSLYHYLAEHPRIYLSPQKESEFFYRDDLYSLGLDWYLNTFFAGAGTTALCGEVCPQYMFHPKVPMRISELIPNVRIIMLLRNPILRAFSHYRMSRRRNRERREFHQVVTEDLASVDQGAVIDTPDYGYLRFGEYGRILTDYLKYFPAHSVKILFSEELSSSRASVIYDVLSFLGEDASVATGKVHRDYNVGGDRRFPKLDRLLRSFSMPKAILKRVLGDIGYARLWYWYESELSVRKRDSLSIGKEERALLRSYYEEDVRLLERIIGRKTPWDDFAASSSRLP